MSDSGQRKEQPALYTNAVVKRRRLFTLGTLLTGVTAVSSLGANSANAATEVVYVPMAEKGMPTGVATLDFNAKIPSAQLPNMSATYASAASVVAPPAAGDVTQRLYSRSVPTPSGASTGVVALATDPRVAGRIWVQGLDFAQIGYSDTDGDTWTVKTNPPSGSAAGVQELSFAGGYAWILQGPLAAKSGSLWRSPLPDSAGSGWAWTKMFDLAAPPSGISTGDKATFRNACVAVSGTHVYLVEYSVAPITGGPSCYYSSDSGATWAKVRTWAKAKHSHAVKIIGGVPWVMNGDAGFSDLGLWNATSVGSMIWNQRSIYGEDGGGNTNYGINFFPISIGGQPMIVSEYDGNRNYGPLVFPSQSISTVKALIPTCQIAPSFMGTMRQLTLTAEGNLMWVQTGENGSVGATDTVMIAKGPHYTQAIALETAPANTTFGGTLGNPVESGDYIWFGRQRVRKEKFLDQ